MTRLLFEKFLEIFKNKTVLVVCGILTLLIGVIGLSYAYFSVTIEGEVTSFAINTATNKLIYTNPSDVNMEDALPGWTDTQTFTVENVSNGKLYYEIIWTEITNEFENIEDFVFTLTGKKNVGETIVPTEERTIVASIAIDPEEVHEYTLTIEWKKASHNQLVDYGAIFMGKIEIRESEAQGPVISIIGGSSINHEVLTEYEDLGATAYDEEDGEVEVIVINNVLDDELGTYEVIYSATNSNGITTTKVRTVIVRDTVAPIISVDPNEVVMTEQIDYDLLTGVSAEDNYDGDLTEEIIVTSTPEFNSNAEGIYEIKYNVSDASKNAAEEVTRMIYICTTTLLDGSVSYSTSSPVMGVPVEVTITANKWIKDIPGWTRTGHNTLTKEYSVNVTETVTIEDLCGNTKGLSVEITGFWIGLYTANQLHSIGRDENYPVNGKYIVMNNIDISSCNNVTDQYGATGYYGCGSNWNPIPSFSGIIEGDYKELNNLTINRLGETNQGLFATLTGEVRNFNMKSVNVTGGGSTGGLVGSKTAGTINSIGVSGVVSCNGNYCGILVGSNSGGTITNSYAKGIVSGTGYAGGLAGRITNTTLNNSYSDTLVTCTADFCGGLVGSIGVGGTTGGSVSLSYSRGEVRGVNYVGGLSGADYTANIDKTYSVVKVVGTGNNIGGLFGFVSTYTGSFYTTHPTISNSFSLGEVSGGATVGGISSAACIGSYTSSGGTVGQDAWSVTTYGGVHYINNYTLARISGSSPTAISVKSPSALPGGVCGTIGEYVHEINSSYYSPEFTEIMPVSSGTPLPIGAMTVESSFIDWDFEEIWGIIDEEEITSTPYLKELVIPEEIYLNNVLLYQYEGTGTLEEPFLIYTEEDLYHIRDTKYSYYKIMNNIILDEYADWDPIPIFGGVLDGDGFTISGLSVNKPGEGNNGLFATMIPGGLVKNLIIDNVTITGGTNSGVIVGINGGVLENITVSGTLECNAINCGGIAGSNTGEITDVSASVVVTSTAGGNAGGLVGTNSGMISSSSAVGNVICNADNCGGLVGSMTAETLTTSFATGNVTSTANNVGGLIGSMTGGTTTLSYASGNVSTSGSRVGGLIGSFVVGGLGRKALDKLYASGNVSGANNVGGLVGYLQYSPASNGSNTLTISNSFALGNVNGTSEIGGLVGRFARTSGGTSGQMIGVTILMDNCYSSGKVSGTSLVGGFSGYSTYGGGGYSGGSLLAPSSYWIADQAGIFISADGIPITIGDSIHKTTYIDWNFDTVWEIIEDEFTFNPISTPYLRELAIPDMVHLSNLDSYYEYEGRGDELNPYLIYNEEDLYHVRDATRANYIIVDDIILDEYANWDAIVDFRGSIDGDGHTISGLNTEKSDSSNIGLFASTVAGSEIKNLIIDAAVVSAGANSGILVGINDGKISNVSLTGNITCTGNNCGGLVGSGSGLIENSSAISEVNGTNYVGGLCGLYTGEITNSFTNTTLIATGDYVGGLVGYASGASEISLSYSSGYVTGRNYVGGLIGDVNVTYLSKTIDKTYSEATVKGTGNYVGGLIGDINNYTSSTSPGGSFIVTVSNSYALGDVSGINEVGGLIGRLHKQSTHVSWVPYITLKNDYSSGKVSGSTLMGGLVGQTASSGTAIGTSSASNSYWISDVALIYTSKLGTEITIEEAIDELTYDTWDFSDIWAIVEDEFTFDPISTPYLKELMIPDGVYVNNITLHQYVGAGTEINPFEIATPEDLNNVRYYLDKYFIFVDDIDMSSYPDFAPILRFAGNLAGDGHTISNLSVQKSGVTNSGLFANTIAGSEIKDLIIDSAVVSGGLNSGILVGNNEGTITGVSITNGEIICNADNCGGMVGTSSGIITESSAEVIIRGTNKVGGLCGLCTGAVSNSYADATVIASGNAAGGLIGDASGAGSITLCYATGSVSGIEEVGGLIGLIYINHLTKIIDKTYSAATVMASGNYVGGLIGRLYAENNPSYGYPVANFTLSNSFALGNVSGVNNVGGLIGRTERYGQASSGPVYMTLVNNYSSGKVVGISNVGGLVGYHYAYAGGTQTITNNYWISDLALINTSAHGSAITTSQAIEELTYNTWDFSDIWAIVEDEFTFDPISTPYLQELMIPDEVYVIDSIPYPYVGSGTEINPFEIATYEDLYNVRYFLDKYFIFVDDVDMSTHPNFIPIENFAGSIDGDGHTISNLSIKRSTVSNQALFTNTIAGSEIKNLIIDGAEIIGGTNSGVLVATNAGMIDSVSVVNGNVECSANYCGGLVGSNSLTANYRVIKDLVSGGYFKNLGATPVLESSEKKYGNGSLYFSAATSQRINKTVPEMDFGVDDFTISFWLKPDTQTMIYAYPLGGEVNNSSLTFALSYGNVSTGNISLAVNGAVIINTGVRYTPGAWKHYAIVRELGVFTVYEDGVSIGSTSSYTGSLVNLSNFSIGGNSSTTNTAYKGYMDDLAVYDYAKWSSNFSVPLGALNDANILHLSFDSETIKAGINNSSFTGVVNASGFDQVGGLAGGGSPSILGSYVDGTILGKNMVGGIIGASSITGTIANSYSKGSVTSTAGSAGGIIGLHNNTGVTITVNTSYSEMNVTSNNTGSSGAGGILGYKSANSVININNCFSTGIISANNAAATNGAGGIIGYTQDVAAGRVNITNSYSIGKITGLAPNKGGILGYYSGTGIVGTNNYYIPEFNDIFISIGNTPATAIGTSITMTVAMNELTYNTWDFINIWGIVEESSIPISTPYLRNLMIPDSVFLNYHVYNGLGTALNPYEIATIEDLDNVRYYLDKYFIFVDDIDMSTYDGFIPIANFAGSIDGDGYTITGLNIELSGVANAGLFASTTSTAEIKDLIITDAVVVGGTNSGIFVGSNAGTITNIEIINGSITCDAINCGGLIGNNTGVVNGNNVNVTLVSTAGGSAGGIAGISNKAMNLNTVTGSITCGNNCGGIVGNAAAGSVVDNSSFTGSISSNGDAVGGIVGNGVANISNSFAIGAITGRNQVGGILGNASIAGTIANTYAKGTLIATAGHIGGILGVHTTASIVVTINTSYSAMDVIGNHTSAIGVGGIFGTKTGTGVININNCFSTGTITNNNSAATSGAGGIIGYVQDVTSGRVNITNTYSIGKITGGAPYKGGVLGYYSGSGIVGTNNYFIPDLNRISNSVGSSAGTVIATSIIVTDAIDELTYNTWDFSTIWEIAEDEFTFDPISTPYLRGLTIPSKVYWENLRDFAGSGTLMNPYEIATPEDLDNVRNYLDKYFILVDDIDLSSYPNFVPITNFAGSLDGDGYTISGLSINGLGVASRGLFANTVVGSEVKNLIIEGAEVKGGTNSGILVGTNNGSISNVALRGNITCNAVNCGGLVGNNSVTGTINASSFTGKVNAKGYDMVGGLIGIGAPNITASYVNAVVTGKNYTGGLIGQANLAGVISESYCKGVVNGSGSTGGVIGAITVASVSITITKTYSEADVITNLATSDGGGLVGYKSGTSTLIINNSYAVGNISATRGKGGLLGYGTGVNTTYLQISNSYSIAKVNAGGNPGGLIGYLSGTPSVSNSYWVGEKAGIATTAGNQGTNISIADSYLESTYNLWDFTSTWEIAEDEFTFDPITSPYLKGLAIPWQIYEHEYVGTGTEGDPYEISTYEDLYSIRYDLSSNYILVNNIDLSNYADFAPIENFAGILDGAQYTISNLKINKSGIASIGLFGSITGTGVVKDLTINGAEVFGGTNSGVIAGTNAGEINNVNVSGYVECDANNCGGITGNNTGLITGSVYSGHVAALGVGGALAGISSGVINASSTSGTISCTASNCGGLVGSMSSGSVTSSYSEINIMNTGSYTGGLIGNVSGSSNITLSYATGSVTGTSYTGGFVGSTTSTGSLNKNYATGSVVGTSYVGGFAGVGNNISNSYSTGAVKGSDFVGGFAYSGTAHDRNYNSGRVTFTGVTSNLHGYSSSECVTCYYPNDAVGVFTSNGGNLIEMGVSNQESTFNNWDFSSIWGIVEEESIGVTTPYLRNMIIPSSVYLSNIDYYMYEGLGTQSNPYMVYTETDLNNIRNGKNAHYKLGSDITLVSSWVPISDFRGVLDGDSNNIYGLRINASGVENVGMFSNTIFGSEIKNLVIDGINVSGGSNTGVIVGTNSGTIKNVEVINSSLNCNADNCGGLTGNNQSSGVINNSSYTGNITSSANVVGGLIGLGAPNVSNSYSEVTMSGVTIIGGIIGKPTASGTILKTYSKGNINATGGIAGGIIGEVSTSNLIVVIDRSYSEANVTSFTGVAGGVIGNKSGTSIVQIENVLSLGNIRGESAGGIIGSGSGLTTINTRIDNTYTIAHINPISTNKGAIAGSISGSVYTKNVYYISAITGVSDVIGINITSGFKTDSSYNGFDFITIWDIQTDITTPYLRGLIIPSGVYS